MLSSRVCSLGIKMGVIIVCTKLMTGNHDLDIGLVTNCKRKSCYAPCAVSVTLPILTRGVRMVTSYISMTSVSNT